MKNRKNMCYLSEKIPKYCVNMPCERCKVRKYADYMEKVPKNGWTSYKGFVLHQYADGDYYIFNRQTKQCVLHAQCTQLLSRRQAREHICYYLKKFRRI